MKYIVKWIMYFAARRGIVFYMSVPSGSFFIALYIARLKLQKGDMMKEKIIAIEREVNKVILGKEEIIRKVLSVILAGGHILLEDIPGVGKTTLALAFSKAMALDFNRVQFTPDVVPSDITGYSIYNKATGNFEYKAGAAMCNILLADEINRTSSKTQSSLLEVMQEGSITVDGETRRMPEPFIVIATQNPLGTAGTQMLPEAQLDRFMAQLSIGYPSKDAEMRILMDRKKENPMDKVMNIAGREELISMKRQVKEVFVHEKIYEYVTDLIRETREHELIKMGISPRGAISICAMGQAWAFIHGRNYVIPQDIRDIFFDTARHRISVNSKAHVQGKSVYEILNGIILNTKVPGVTKE